MSQQDRGLRIGAVSRITHIPVDTLRAWERRYGVVAPQRNPAAARLYSEADVERLRLIKQLVDRGHGIGTIARMTVSELEAQLALHAPAAEPQTRQHSDAPATVLAYAEHFYESLGAMDLRAQGIELLASARSWTDLEEGLSSYDPDVLLLEVGAVLPATARRLRRIVERRGARLNVLVYGYAASDLLAQLSESGLTVLKGPVPALQWVQLVHTALGAGHPPQPPDPGEVVAERLLSDHALGSVASHASAVKCECPRHLADIIIRLCQFEEYSKDCRNESREDAALHAMLTRVTASARRTFEDALVEVAGYENIELPDERAD